MTQGYLITIEGTDRSGKSTLAQRLSTNDIPTNHDTTFTREPTDSPPGKLLRKILRDGNNDVLSELFLFMADHSIHVNQTIEPALKRGELVICDRYINSRCAYQGLTLENGFENPMEFITNLHQPWSRFPDLTILLDLPADEAVKRTSTTEKYETENRLTAIRDNYLTLCEEYQDRYVTIDATQSQSEIHKETVDAITRELL